VVPVEFEVLKKVVKWMFKNLKYILCDFIHVDFEKIELEFMLHTGFKVCN
jgi:hypothetical protein